MFPYQVINGTQKTNYKPNHFQYWNALMRTIEKEELIPNYEQINLDAFLKEYPDLYKKHLYLLLKCVINEFAFSKDYEIERLYFLFDLTITIESMVAELTPRQFLHLYPIAKSYDGEKYGIKDYYYTVEYIQNIGMNQPIGKERAMEFLMEYVNPDIFQYICVWMKIVNRMNQFLGLGDIMEEFAKEQGLKLKTYYREGNFLIDSETGETIEIQKEKVRRGRQFRVVK